MLGMNGQRKILISQGGGLFSDPVPLGEVNSVLLLLGLFRLLLGFGGLGVAFLQGAAATTGIFLFSHYYHLLYG